MVVSNVLAQLYTNYEVERKTKGEVLQANLLAEERGLLGAPLGLDSTLQYDKKGRPIKT